MARVHRIGQKKTVHIYRLVSQVGDPLYCKRIYVYTLSLTLISHLMTNYHIYYLVSQGSVEERIVQRAQKKLFLDSMVNRGSTARALALDGEKNQAQGQGLGEKDDQDDSKLLSTLLFGWNSVFSLSGSSSSGGGSGNGNGSSGGNGSDPFDELLDDVDAGLQGMTDEQLNALIDRTR